MLTLPLILDLTGTFVFALSGAILAVRRDFDIVGVVVLAISAGLGGGIIRDVLLGAVPPKAITDSVYLLTAMSAALLGFFLSSTIERFSASFRLLDAIGLGFFAVAGTARSLDADIGAVQAVLLGVVSGAGGGVVRDLLAREVPLILRGDVYALAALAGAAAYSLTGSAGLSDPIRSAIGISLTFVVRLLAIRYGWQAPRPRHRDGPAVAKGAEGWRDAGT